MQLCFVVLGKFAKHKAYMWLFRGVDFVCMCVLVPGIVAHCALSGNDDTRDACGMRCAKIHAANRKLAVVVVGGGWAKTQTHTRAN